jgi:DNA-binding transcriptional ArsR family regulator
MGLERETFKIDIRKLKESGLTESLEVGYRLSRRGKRLLAHLRSLSPKRGR